MNTVIGAFQVGAVQHVLFSVAGKIREHGVDKTHGMGIPFHLVAVVAEMMNRQSVMIGGAGIGLRRGDLVADALDGINVRHLRCDGAIPVEPVFDMMLIAPFMMKPRIRDARLTAGGADGRAVPPIILRALEKFGGRKLGEVVYQPAPNDPALHGVSENAGFMTPDQGKMAKNIRYFHKNLVPILKIMGFSGYS